MLCRNWASTNACWQKFAGGEQRAVAVKPRHAPIAEGGEEDEDDEDKLDVWDSTPISGGNAAAGRDALDEPLLRGVQRSAESYGATHNIHNPLRLAGPPHAQVSIHSPKTPRLGTIELKSGAPPRLPVVPHVIFTIIIVVSALEIALSIPSITVVWSIMGSSVAMVIMYLVPAACYLKIRKVKGWTPRRVGALMMLVIVTPLCIACTAQAVTTAMTTTSVAS